MTDRTPVLMAATAVALSARTNTLTAHAVDDMRIRAEELLPPDDPLRPAVIRFATMFLELRRDPYALSKLGEELERAVSEALHPDRRPIEPRRDIDG